MSFSAPKRTKTKLHALHQLGAFVHELLLGNGCLLIDLQIHGSDGPRCGCSGHGGCSGRGADAGERGGMHRERHAVKGLKDAEPFLFELVVLFEKLFPKGTKKVARTAVFTACSSKLRSIL